MDTKPYSIDDVLVILRRKLEEMVIGDGMGDGAFDFHHAGKLFGQCLWRLQPNGVAPAEWHARLQELRKDVQASGVVASFEEEFPTLIALVPANHRPVFVAAALDMIGVQPPNPVRHEARKLAKQSRNRKRSERRKKSGGIDGRSTKEYTQVIVR